MPLLPWIEAEDELLQSFLYSKRYTCGLSNFLWRFQEIAENMNRRAPELGLDRRQYTTGSVQTRAHQLEKDAKCRSRLERANAHDGMLTFHETFLNGETSLTQSPSNAKEKSNQGFIADRGLNELPFGCTEPYEYPGGFLPPNVSSSSTDVENNDGLDYQGTPIESRRPSNPFTDIKNYDYLDLSEGDGMKKEKDGAVISKTDVTSICPPKDSEEFDYLDYYGVSKETRKMGISKE